MKVHFSIELTWIAELWQIVTETWQEWDEQRAAKQAKLDRRCAILCGEIPKIEVRRKYL